jgi:hypothetical protein
MTLILEDGTGLSNAESYASVAEANTYFTNRNITAWTGTDAVKEAALRKATDYLDATYSWAGSGILVDTQALGFPRLDLYDSEGRDISSTVPKKLKNATCELALASLSGDLLKNKENSNFVKREKVGSIEVEYRDNAVEDRQYVLAERLLVGLFSSKSGSYGYAQVIR